LEIKSPLDASKNTRSDFLSLRGSDLPTTRVIEAKWKQRAALINLTEVCFYCKFFRRFTHVTFLWFLEYIKFDFPVLHQIKSCGK